MASVTVHTGKYESYLYIDYSFGQNTTNRTWSFSSSLNIHVKSGWTMGSWGHYGNNTGMLQKNGMPALSGGNHQLATYSTSGNYDNNGTAPSFTLTWAFNVNSSWGGYVYPHGSINVTGNAIGALAYTVSYNANGGTGAPGSQTKYHGTNLTLSSTKPTRANTTANGYTVTFNGNGGTPSKTSATATNTTSYSFVNWNTASGGGGTAYSSGGTYSANAGATLYAQWSSSTSRGSVTTATASKSNGSSSRTVSLNANGGSCSTSSLTSTAPITYTCTGWYTATSGGTKRASAGAAYTPSASETVYAQWSSSTGTYSAVTLPAATKANSTATATVSFNANGGSCSTNSLQATATTTYSHAGWYTATTGGTRRGGANSTYTPSASETLYAQFTSSVGNYGTITLPTPTRAGYNFNGWATSSSATSGVLGTYTPTGNVTLYATWSIAEDAVMHYKENGEWMHGVAYYKENGAWTKARRIYIKENGVWIQARNSLTHEELAQYTHAELAAYTYDHIRRGCL